jgi:transcriptional repressor of cell division inhibition gene dicB
MTKDDVLKFFGGTVKTAEAIGVRHTTVSMWGDYPPSGRQCEIELLTGGALKREPKTPSLNKSSHPCAHHQSAKIG